MKTICKLITLVVFAALVLLLMPAARPAHADPTFDISVDVGGYPGRWWVPGGGGALAAENQVIALAPGAYTFSLVNVLPNVLFQFTVDAAGNVTTSDPAQATGGLLSLTLITHPVAIDASGYPGRWVLSDWPAFSENQTIPLPAATYQFSLINVLPNVLFQFTVDPAGGVMSLDDHKAIGGAGSLTLITRSIHFDLGGAPGTWVFGDTSPSLVGNQTSCLTPATYNFRLGAETFEYAVDNSAGVFLFTVSPTSATILVGGTPYTVRLSLATTPCGGFDFGDLAFDNLDSAIANADVDVAGVRNSLQAKAGAARAAFEQGNLATAGNILCALLHEVDAQDGQHIAPASAQDIRDAVENAAAALGIPLPCMVE